MRTFIITVVPWLESVLKLGSKEQILATERVLFNEVADFFVARPMDLPPCNRTETARLLSHNSRLHGSATTSNPPLRYAQM